MQVLAKRHKLLQQLKDDIITELSAASSEVTPMGATEPTMSIMKSASRAAYGDAMVLKVLLFELEVEKESVSLAIMI